LKTVAEIDRLEDHFAVSLVFTIYSQLIYNTPQINISRPTQPSISPGSVNEYQAKAWFIPLSHERGVFR